MQAEITKSRRTQEYLTHIATLRAQAAERRALIGDVSEGAIFTEKTFTQWVFLLPDMTESGKWRMQRFDHNGFSGHAIFNTHDELVDAAASGGFLIPDQGALDRLQGTFDFQRGNFWSEQIQRVNAREITFQQANQLLTEFVG